MMIPSPASNAPRVGRANLRATAASAMLAPIAAMPAANKPSPAKENIGRQYVGVKRAITTTMPASKSAQQSIPMTALSSPRIIKTNIGEPIDRHETPSHHHLPSGEICGGLVPAVTPITLTARSNAGFAEPREGDPPFPLLIYRGTTWAVSPTEIWCVAWMRTLARFL